MAEWVQVAETKEFEATDRKYVELSPMKHVGLFKIKDEYFAIDAWCSHARASLVHGEVVDHEVQCPLHGARFDLRTGRHLSPPAVRPVARYEVKVEDGKILVKT